MSTIVLPFIASGVITAQWGEKTRSYPVLELRIYKTKESWDKRNGPLADLIKGKKNLFKRFGDKASTLLTSSKPKVFVITPIQGEKHGESV